MIILLLGFIAGLLVGFWAKDVYITIHNIERNHKAQKDYEQAGVVRPGISRGATPQPINMESKTGGVRRPTPEQATLANMKAREERLKSL